MLLREPFYGRAPPGAFGKHCTLCCSVYQTFSYMRQRSAAVYYTYYYIVLTACPLMLLQVKGNWKGISHSVRFLQPLVCSGRRIKKEKDKSFGYEMLFFTIKVVSCVPTIKGFYIILNRVPVRQRCSTAYWSFWKLFISLTLCQK